jgi:hypothetical protein
VPNAPKAKNDKKRPYIPKKQPFRQEMTAIAASKAATNAVNKTPNPTINKKLIQQ